MQCLAELHGDHPHRPRQMHVMSCGLTKVLSFRGAHHNWQHVIHRSHAEPTGAKTVKTAKHGEPRTFSNFVGDHCPRWFIKSHVIHVAQQDDIELAFTELLTEVKL